MDFHIRCEDLPEEVRRKEIQAARQKPWNRGLPEGYTRYQLPDGSLGVFDTSATPNLGETFVGRLRLTPERASDGRPGWTRRRLLARLSPGLYQIDIGTKWERLIEWPDDDICCIGVLVSVHEIAFFQRLS